MMLRRSLGAYPEDSYFDRERPSWLPYWIDTPTESNRKYNAANLIQATANAAGMAAGNVVGTVVSSVASGVAYTADAAVDKLKKELEPSGYLVLAAGAAVLFLLLKGKR